MAIIAGTSYDPGTAVHKATTALLAMTAFDTTNLRLTFTAPASGKVMVRIRTLTDGNSTGPNILLGVLEGSTVIARQTPIASAVSAATSARNTQEACFTVSGISAGSHTWDAAYAVQLVQTLSEISYGGPDNTTSNDAWGIISFEIWEVTNQLGAILYDPGTAVSKATSSLLAMTAFDTTNLRLTFTAPASGNVIVKLRCVITGSSTAPQILLGVLESSTVKARGAPLGGRTNQNSLAAGSWQVYEEELLITGLSAGSHSFDAAYSVDIAVASTNIKYGGPNDTAGADAWGGLSFEVWAA